jgi:hypothetical protein
MPSAPAAVCPINNNYKQAYLAIKYDYDTSCTVITDDILNQQIANLDTKVQAYQLSVPDTRPSFCFNSAGVIQGHSDIVADRQMYTESECQALLQRASPGSTWSSRSFQGYDVSTARFQANYYGFCQSADGATAYSYTCRTPSTISTQRAQQELTTAFQPIGEYYANLNSIKKRLIDFLECSSKQVSESTAGTINEERYNERANPQEAVMPRELVFGLFSELRPSSIPFILAAGVFMSCMSLLMIFQMLGFTGEIHMPPALSPNASFGEVLTSLAQNPMVLSGISIVAGVGLTILYYRSKK